MMKQQSTPEIDLDVFDGNPLNFHYFMAAFRETVEKKIEDSCGRLSQLIKYITVEVKDMATSQAYGGAEDTEES